MRYFLTSNANLPYTAGGFAFTFEPVVIRGGSWLGVLAVAEDAAASALAASGINQVEEITLEQYEAVKKKTTAGPSNFPSSQNNRNEPEAVRPQVRVAEPAERLTGLPSAADDIAHGVNPITLLARNLNPPDEPLLVETAKGKPKL